MDYVSLFGNKKLSVCPFKLLDTDKEKLERILNINNEYKCPDHFLSPTITKIASEIDFNIFRIKKDIKKVQQLNDLTDPLLLSALQTSDLLFYDEISSCLVNLSNITGDKVEALRKEKHKCYRKLLAYTRYNLILLLKKHLETEQIPYCSTSIYSFLTVISNRTKHLTTTECIETENCISSTYQIGWSSSSSLKQKISNNINEIINIRNKFDLKILKMCILKIKSMTEEEISEYCKTNLFNYKVFVNDDLIRLIGGFIHY